MVKKTPSRARTAAFIEAMECLPVSTVPEGPEWTYELKLDGYRLGWSVPGSETTLYSRRENVLNAKFPYIASALHRVPQGTVIDGELVALGPDGKPNFNMLQNFRSAEEHIIYYAFDILVLRDRDLTMLPLAERRNILRSVITPADHVALSEVSDQTATEMLKFVRSHGLEGIVAKRTDSIYQPGLQDRPVIETSCQSWAGVRDWRLRPGTHGFDSLVIGFYRGRDLYYAARVRAGFVPATRREVFEQIKHLKTEKCPFVNLPEKQAGRWGQGLTAEKMKECVWLKPEAVANFEFLEWTGADHLRHTKFTGMRDDKDPRKVGRET